MIICVSCSKLLVWLSLLEVKDDFVELIGILVWFGSSQIHFLGKTLIGKFEIGDWCRMGSDVQDDQILNEESDLVEVVEEW